MKRILMILLLLFSTTCHAQANLTPILVSDGMLKMVCDGQLRFMYTTPLVNQTIVRAYLFGNLVTDEGHGADIVLWSDTYGGWGPIADLHIFWHRHGGGRQGESERNFAPDGILINGVVQVAAACGGGGTLEIYSAIWVK